MRSTFAIAATVLVFACGTDPNCPPGTELQSDVCDVADSVKPLPVVDAGQEHDAEANLCFLDQDLDGIGQGAPVECTPDSATTGALAVRDGDCDDTNPAVGLGFEELCDNLDNDCDGEVDNGLLNACGGACSEELAAQPGDECDNGLLGACAQAGIYVCDDSGAITCDATVLSPTGELCGNDIDDDCDGETDESDAADAPVWYRDCDGDGYSATDIGSRKACTEPSASDNCAGWTQRAPAEQHATIDCNDARPDIYPGSDFLQPDGTDVDCSGEVEHPPFLFNDGMTPLAACPDRNACDCYLATHQALPDGTFVKAPLSLPFFPEDFQCGALYVVGHLVPTAAGCEFAGNGQQADYQLAMHLCL